MPRAMPGTSPHWAGHLVQAAAYLLIGGPVGPLPIYTHEILSLGKLDKEILEGTLGGKGTR